MNLSEYDWVQIGKEDSQVNDAKVVVKNGTSNTIKAGQTFVNDHAMLVYGNLTFVSDGSEDDTGTLKLDVDDNITGTITALSVSGNLAFGSDEGLGTNVEVKVGNSLKNDYAIKADGDLTIYDGSITCSTYGAIGDTSGEVFKNYGVYCGGNFTLGNGDTSLSPSLTSISSIGQGGVNALTCAGTTDTSFVMKNGELNAKSILSAAGDCAAIDIYNENVSFEGGTVTATAGSGADSSSAYSYGIRVNTANLVIGTTSNVHEPQITTSVDNTKQIRNSYSIKNDDSIGTITILSGTTTLDSVLGKGVVSGSGGIVLNQAEFDITNGKQSYVAGITEIDQSDSRSPLTLKVRNILKLAAGTDNETMAASEH